MGYDLERFVEAQGPVYEQVLSELAAGRKRTHWMWFIFPQIQGLGSSSTARHYAIASLEEARAYLAHPVLGPRLRACTALVNAVRDRDLTQILGYPDDLKFRSSMTLFAQAADPEDEQDDIFDQALSLFADGVPDAATLERL